jgi:succinate dehydrogenase / fumarate reductase iron-sulfur subunit
MVELTLPKNSKVGEGKVWPKPAGAKETRAYRIYRWNPDDGQNPRVDTYYVDTADCGPMILDALIWIKNKIDPTLTFRRSCREGVCGSCAMNIDGTNTLACTRGADEVKHDTIRIYPLPHQPVIKDLVPDLTNFYAQHAAVQPYLQTVFGGAREGMASDQGRPRQARRPLRVHPVRLLLHRLPELLVELGALHGPGRAAAGTPLADRHADEKTGERLDDLEDPFRLYRCHTIMNCAKACPKSLNPAKAIAEIKAMMVERQVIDSGVPLRLSAYVIRAG